jgi:hypothetical protein
VARPGASLHVSGAALPSEIGFSLTLSLKAQGRDVALGARTFCCAYPAREGSAIGDGALPSLLSAPIPTEPLRAAHRGHGPSGWQAAPAGASLHYALLHFASRIPLSRLAGPSVLAQEPRQAASLSLSRPLVKMARIARFRAGQR